MDTPSAAESGLGGRRPGAAAGRHGHRRQQRGGLRRAAVAPAAPRWRRWIFSPLEAAKTGGKCWSSPGQK